MIQQKGIFLLFGHLSTYSNNVLRNVLSPLFFFFLNNLNLLNKSLAALIDSDTFKGHFPVSYYTCGHGITETISLLFVLLVLPLLVCALYHLKLDGNMNITP